MRWRSDPEEAPVEVQRMDIALLPRRSNYMEGRIVVEDLVSPSESVAEQAILFRGP